MELLEDKMCFVCGPENPIGLKLEFWEEGETYRTRFTPDRRHSSYSGVMHGGILTAILDEVMGRLLYVRNLRAATAKMEIRWSRAAKIGETLHFSGWIEVIRGRLIQCAAEARDDEGCLIARSNAKFMRVIAEKASPDSALPVAPATGTETVECCDDSCEETR